MTLCILPYLCAAFLVLYAEIFPIASVCVPGLDERSA